MKITKQQLRNVIKEVLNDDEVFGLNQDSGPHGESFVDDKTETEKPKNFSKDQLISQIFDVLVENDKVQSLVGKLCQVAAAAVRPYRIGPMDPESTGHMSDYAMYAGSSIIQDLSRSLYEASLDDVK